MKPHWAYIEATDENERKILERLVGESQAKIFIDVGCFIGGFTAIMAREAKKRSGKVYSIDIFKKSYEPLDFWKEHHDYNVKDIFCDNMISIGVEAFVCPMESISWEAAKDFSDEEVDFIFIDADHKYESVKKDIEAWLPKLKKGGIISGHDFNIKAPILAERGVQQAVEELFKTFNVENRIWWHRKE